MERTRLLLVWAEWTAPGAGGRVWLLRLECGRPNRGIWDNNPTSNQISYDGG